MALMAAISTMAACSGPTSPVPTGFPRDGCVTGPSIHGAAGMGVTDDGFATDVDAQIAVTGSTNGGCVRAELGDDD